MNNTKLYCQVPYLEKLVVNSLLIIIRLDYRAVQVSGTTLCK